MNVMINGAWVQPTDKELLFGDEEVIYSDQTEIPNLLKELGVFKSTSEARRAGRDGKIADGFTFNFKASKKVRMWIWNPTS